MRATVVPGIADCVAVSVRSVIPKPPEWQRIGDQTDAPFIFALADFVNLGCIAWLDVLTGSALT